MVFLSAGTATRALGQDEFRRDRIGTDVADGALAEGVGHSPTIMAIVAVAIDVPWYVLYLLIVPSPEFDFKSSAEPTTHGADRSSKTTWPHLLRESANSAAPVGRCGRQTGVREDAQDR